MAPPPPLPRSLADPRPVVVAGTIAAFVAAAILAVTGADSLWMWTCLAGGGLGMLGWGIMRWQTAAVRRGSCGAQQGLG